MERAKASKILVGLLIQLTAVAASAQAVTFVPAGSAYEDDKKVPLRGPEGVACTDTGVVVADTGNGRLVAFTYRDGAFQGGTEIKLAQLPYPTELQSDSKGNLIALDRKSRRLVRLDRSGAFLGLIEFKGPGGAASVAPRNFQIDGADNLHVLDLAGGGVIVADPAGNVTRQVALPRQGTFTGIAVDAAGTTYVMEVARVEVWVADRAATSFTPLGVNLRDLMSFPGYLTAVRGRLFLVDQNGHGLVLLGLDGSFQGRQLTMGASEGTVQYPSQLCVNGRGQAFVADRGNNRVQAFTLQQ